jgi:DNA-binding response OmpR family regulator
MEPKTPKMRLDEILLSEGLVSEEQIREALLRQKAYGGKFGSQLLYHRYIDEAGLVKALAIQFDCEGVVLSDKEISDLLLQMIPKKVALARRVIPFDYDTEENVLMIACSDPTDANLVNELNFVARGKKVKLFIAAEIALDTAIARHYLGQKVTLQDNLLLEIPDVATATDRIVIPEESIVPQADSHPTVLLVTDEMFAAPLLQSLFERDHYRVLICDSVAEAFELLNQHLFHTIFIKDTVSGDYLGLIDRARKISPRTLIRYYSAASSLLLDSDSVTTVADLLMKNLDLFTSLLSSKAQLPENHGGRVGHYANRLCRKLGLPDKDRVMICNVAYIHNLARFYYSTDDIEDHRRVIQLTVKILGSLNYSPVVVEMLRLMYVDLEGGYDRRLPIEVLGGNILTIVDLFCDSIPHTGRLSLDKLDAIKKRLRTLIGKLFLPEVVEAFVEMLQEEILDVNTGRRMGQVMIYTEDLSLLQLLEMRLHNEGFGTVSHNSPEPFLDLYHRSEPDVVILAVPGKSEQVAAFVGRLKEDGLAFDRKPVFLLVEREAVADLTYLLERGIEDVIPVDDYLDLLVTKIRKFQVRTHQGNNGSGAIQTAGARGRLADMNLIDLIQALGPGRKTVRITIQADQPGCPTLTIYLDNGRIIQAELQNLVGAEAVYEGLTWADGSWLVEPMTADDLPEPNTQESNESLLMEGCRRLDERIKTGHLL